MKRRFQIPRARELLKIALLLLAIFWLSSLVSGIWRKEQLARESVGTARAELAALEERHTDLTEQVEALETPRGQETVIRQNMRVARPGEEVIIVVPEEAPLPPPPPTFWEKVWSFLPWN